LLKRFAAIAAMSLNRVIGANNQIPWHLPADFAWFKKMTTGQVIVMGRKTYESIGRPLPNRTTIVLSRERPAIAGVEVMAGLGDLQKQAAKFSGRQIFICGGADIYRQALPSCSDLYLTLVKRTVEGDTFFPPFEDQFVLKDTLLETSEFKVLHYASVEP
jgi:dihydrofolate reductase